MDSPSEENMKETSLRRRQFTRNRLLNEELDRLSVDATDRFTSVNNKASFLAVSAGVIIAASTSQLWSVAPAFSIWGLILAFIALASAAVTLRPGRTAGLNGQRVVDLYQDSSLSAAQVEESLVKSKGMILGLREKDLRNRAIWVWIGFVSLAGGTLALLVTFAFEVLKG